MLAVLKWKVNKDLDIFSIATSKATRITTPIFIFSKDQSDQNTSLTKLTLPSGTSLLELEAQNMKLATLNLSDECYV